MFDDEEIEILDFEDSKKTSSKNTYEPLVVENENIKEKESDTKIKTDDIIIEEVKLLNNNIKASEEKVTNNDKKRTKVIVAKKRKRLNSQTTEKKRKVNGGYIIIILVILVSLILMINMILNVEDKHTKTTSDEEKITENEEVVIDSNKEERTTTCSMDKIDNTTNIRVEKIIEIVSIENEVKEITITEREQYKTQDNLYMQKISNCNTNVEQYNSYEGYSAMCNIDDYNNTVTTVTNYKLEKISSNNIQLLKPPLLLNSNINDAVQNYENMNYICE